MPCVVGAVATEGLETAHSFVVVWREQRVQREIKLLYSSSRHRERNGRAHQLPAPWEETWGRG
eukprot:2260978-Prymnesium_polylepis.5